MINPNIFPCIGELNSLCSSTYHFHTNTNTTAIVVEVVGMFFYFIFFDVKHVFFITTSLHIHQPLCHHNCFVYHIILPTFIYI